MSRKKRTSRILEKAELRSAGLKAIDANMSFGDDCHLQNLSQAIEQLRTMLDAYNVIDSSKTKIDAMEKTLSNLTDKMVRGVAFKYGKDSSEYEMAGGVRDSERIRKSRLSRLKSAAGETSDKNPKTT